MDGDGRIMAHGNASICQSGRSLVTGLEPFISARRILGVPVQLTKRACLGDAVRIPSWKVRNRSVGCIRELQFSRPFDSIMETNDDLLICKACATQFDVPSDKPLKHCKICDV